MTAELMASWLLSVMLATTPPGRSRTPEEARETAEAGKARYAAIAGALAEVTLDPREPPVFQGSQGRERTALLMLAVAYYESTWRRDVDLGIGPRAHGSGRYHCLMQIGVGQGKTAEGWTGKQLTDDRQKCFRAALHILQRGTRVCRGKGETAFLNHYASGYCDRGRIAVEKRVALYRRWWGEHPAPKPDERPEKPSTPASPRRGEHGGRDEYTARP